MGGENLDVRLGCDLFEFSIPSAEYKLLVAFLLGQIVQVEVEYGSLNQALDILKNFDEATVKLI